MASTTPVTNPPPPATRPAGSPWSILAAAQFLTVSARHLHRLIDSQKVKSILLGRRRLIPDSEVQRLAREGC
jgi:excisionase family DNA binding protein